LGNRLGNRWRREAAKQTHIRQIHIEVAAAIGVTEEGAIALDGEDGTPVIETPDPAHGCARGVSSGVRQILQRAARILSQNPWFYDDTFDDQLTDSAGRLS
jgi:hypothetical protein